MSESIKEIIIIIIILILVIIGLVFIGGCSHTQQKRGLDTDCYNECMYGENGCCLGTMLRTTYDTMETYRHSQCFNW